MLANVHYVTYQQWVTAMIEDERISALAIGIAVHAIHYEDASNEELQISCHAGKRAILQAKKTLKDTYLDVTPVRGQGKRPIIKPRMPNGDLVILDSDENLSGANMRQQGDSKETVNPDENCRPVAVTLPSHCRHDASAKTHHQKGSPPPNDIYSNPPPLPNERERSARGEFSNLKIEQDTIEGPGFRIDLAAVDMTATLMGYDPAKARKLATVMAMDWVANNFAPDSPIAKIKWALKNDHNDDQQQGVRMQKLQQRQQYGSSKADKDQADREETKRLIMEKMANAARV